MNFKSISLHVAVVTALITTSTLAIAPAHAATVGSKLDFGWLGKIDSVTPKIDFLNLNLTSGASTGQFVVQGTSTGSFAGLGIGTIKDLGLSELTSLSGSTGVANFLTAGSETFKLLNLSVGSSTINFEGVFGNNVKGVGAFTIVGTQPGGFFAYQGSVTAVPTPALLPGLLAMGISVLRKRKTEETEAVKSEA